MSKMDIISKKQRIKMKKVLITLVHPNLSESKINKLLSENISKENNITINNLYSKYPDFKINIEEEQKLLLENDVIIFQFPMYWLSSPALLKEWFDTVFSYNFAYGENYKLEGKIFAVATSTGGSKEQYQETGENKFTVESILNSFEASANYVKMTYKEPFITYSTFTITNEELEKSALDYKNYINNLCK